MSALTSRCFLWGSSVADKSWILIVDDDADGALALRKLLERSGYFVMLAHTVAEARKLCDRNNFDLIICDVRLPDGNGLNLLAYLRKTCSTAEGIVVSGWDQNELQESAESAGYGGHLVKPIDFAKLKETVHRLLTTRPV